MKTAKLVFLILLLTMHILFGHITQSQATDISEFEAVYHRLLDYYTHEINISLLAFSGNGNKIFFCGKDASSELVFYTVDAAGGNLQQIPVPAGVSGVDAVTINDDGSKAFFLDSGNDYIYKVENGAATEILHRTDYTGISNIDRILCTADGNSVYLNDGDDIWKVSHAGGTPEIIIDDESVQRVEGRGRNILDFAISANGDVIGFILTKYVDAQNSSTTKYEVFVLKGGNLKQLTNDAENVYKGQLDVSGDGSTLVFSAESSINMWYSIETDGTGRVALDPFTSNAAAVSLTHNGDQVLVKSAFGSRLLNTDGSYGINILPQSNANTISVTVSDNGFIDNDGDRICFRYKIRSFPSRYALYVGHLHTSTAVPNAPVIQDIRFDPSGMPNSDPNAAIKVFSTISDPDGLADIDEVSLDGLIDGEFTPNDLTQVPVLFSQNPNDNGDFPDEIEDDGIFSSTGKAGDMLNAYDQMTVRIGVMDMSSTVVVRDKVLKIGGAIGVEQNDSVPDLFALYPNYPNPFNPATTIRYQLFQKTHVNLSVLNIQGREVKRLVDETQKPGFYAVQWDGSDQATGVYLLSLQAEDLKISRRMLLLK